MGERMGGSRARVSPSRPLAAASLPVAVCMQHTSAAASAKFASSRFGLAAAAGPARASLAVYVGVRLACGQCAGGPGRAHARACWDRAAQPSFLLFRWRRAAPATPLRAFTRSRRPAFALRASSSLRRSLRAPREKASRFSRSSLFRSCASCFAIARTCDAEGGSVGAVAAASAGVAPRAALAASFLRLRASALRLRCFAFPASEREWVANHAGRVEGAPAGALALACGAS